ncbi:MAG: sialate O-acetylesterase [Planctomycetaceae bacterium]
MMSARDRSCFVLLAAVTLATSVHAAERLAISHPLSHQVVQRDATAPGAGHAEVAISGTAPAGTANCAWACRVVPIVAGAQGDVAWQPVTFDRDGESFRTSLRIPAGGWYRLELRGEDNGTVVCAGAVEPFGVGEVFVIAGQSYATNTNEHRHNVQDRQRRITAYDSAGQTWRVAYDPQPTPDGSDGGSIWPPLGDALAEQLQVPIGFANVAWGGTASKQWLPGEQLHQRLLETGRRLGRFRAVLWQQGESDVILKTPIETYVSNLVEIRTSAVNAWGFEPCWLLAKSTHHPTVYNDPEGETRIRAAIDELVRRPGFCAGPDTDTLQGENRGDRNSRRHFSAPGQVRAAALWQQAITLLLTKTGQTP